MGMRALLVVVAVAAASPPAAAQRADDVVVIDRPTAEDLYLVGQDVEIRAPVEGDVVGAGQRVTIEANVAQDATVAGEDVVVRANVGDDLRAAGRTVRIGAPVDGHAVLAGETVVIDRDASVRDFAWLAGRNVEVRGTVGSLRAYGERVTIDAEVSGDAEVAADTIRLAPGAVVRGDLRWSGEHAPMLAGAQVDGSVVRVERAVAEPPAASVLGALFWIASVIVAAIMVLLAFPRFSTEVGRAARTTPVRSIGAGLAVLAGVPILIALSFLTGVLWIVGVLLLAAYLFALFAGAILGVLAAGDLALDLVRRSEAAPSRWQRALAAVIMGLIVGAVALVPVLGPMVVLVLTVAGAGAAFVSLWGMRGRPPITEPLPGHPSPA